MLNSNQPKKKLLSLLCFSSPYFSTSKLLGHLVLSSFIIIIIIMADTLLKDLFSAWRMSEGACYFFSQTQDVLESHIDISLVNDISNSNTTLRNATQWNMTIELIPLKSIIVICTNSYIYYFTFLVINNFSLVINCAGQPQLLLV